MIIESSDIDVTATIFSGRDRFDLAVEIVHQR